MNVKYLIFTVLETIVKVVVIAVVMVFVFRTATQAYDFGYRVFADQPVSVSGGRTITVSVAEGASVKEVAQMLEEKGLIEDANLFRVQELLSAYHGKMVPGIYDLSTDMRAEEMLEIMSASIEEEDFAGTVNMPDMEDEADTEGMPDMEDAVFGEDMEDAEGVPDDVQ